MGTISWGRAYTVPVKSNKKTNGHLVPCTAVLRPLAEHDQPLGTAMVSKVGRDGATCTVVAFVNIFICFRNSDRLVPVFLAPIDSL